MKLDANPNRHGHRQADNKGPKERPTTRPTATLRLGQGVRLTINRRLTPNRHVFSRTVLDSGSITAMTAVMHRFAQPGSYLATVCQGGTPYATFNLLVDKNAPMGTLDTIDLGDVKPSYTVNSETETVFTSPRGPGGYSVMVEKLDKDRGARSSVFDSRLLGKGDIFVAILLRPGRYTATNQHGARCEISLSLATEGLSRQISGTREVALQSRLESCSIQSTKKGFNPNKVDIQTAQPLLFQIKASLRIKISLEPADSKTTPTTLSTHATPTSPSGRSTQQISPRRRAQGPRKDQKRARAEKGQRPVR